MTTRTSKKDFLHFSPFPYWLLFILLVCVLLLWGVAKDGDYQQIFFAIFSGVGVTLYVAVLSFSFAFLVGLLVSFCRISKNLFLYQISTFYVEIIRGIPMLVLLYYIAFVGAPELVRLLNWFIIPFVRLELLTPFSVRSINFTLRAILALSIGYSAFIAEIFRAGIESIAKGQSEAGQSLGLTRRQTMRLIIFPQAFRNVLPPLGNDFVAMVKDSALVSALGVQDITQLGKVYSASSFLFFETYNIVAFLYLTITISLSLLIRLLENYLKKHKTNKTIPLP